jgi:hypothetical protein
MCLIVIPTQRNIMVFPHLGHLHVWPSLNVLAPSVNPQEQRISLTPQLLYSSHTFVTDTFLPRVVCFLGFKSLPRKNMVV